MPHGWTAYLLVQVAVTSTTTVKCSDEIALTEFTLSLSHLCLHSINGNFG